MPMIDKSMRRYIYNDNCDCLVTSTITEGVSLTYPLLPGRLGVMQFWLKGIHALLHVHPSLHEATGQIVFKCELLIVTMVVHNL